ncbi:MULTISPECIES: SRPBCC family protein [unclassified Paenibacillus]|uniref:SRPBCC family protein n=1 Tax=unclassified Paenibacillus TaxID=185978 RepID=UPI0009542AFE|nr:MULTISPECIES: SRPBCC family protein [unclassified Paenibacillus]ASS65237.2 hypothetical protein CIC07_03210 [Paenibacillus sp. RUD330]SIQ43143.1 Polyketide cyclase / dehydrase and lipid transport [Paenibacillus sp. RU4X]SIQ65403.1 Polyketide cyclase / dehydrase and lipid transport [Paenibacillus sp. RU4T]
MHTYNEIYIDRAPDEVFPFARDVDQWPVHLHHYRSVSFRTGAPEYGIVKMAAWRHFGRLRWPVWWVSRMESREDERRVLYRHIEGVTKGMDVEWKLEPSGAGTRASIVHEWDRPPVGGLAARGIIGPAFVQVIADRTLAGIKFAAEAAGMGHRS